MTTRRLLGVLISAVLMLGTISISPAAAGEGDSCYPGTYETRYRILSHHKAVVLTHARTWDLPPGGKMAERKSVWYRQSFKSQVQFEADASFTAGRIIAKASGSISLKLKAAGSWTKRTKWTDFFSIKNTTNRNHTYALYAGSAKHFGRYRIITCGSDYRIHWQTGHWKSWVAQGAGSARCGLAPSSVLGAKAMRAVC
jgi:hypothetical protein